MFFPDSQSYKTIISSISQQSREEIDKLLPFSLHYYEIGRHHLYAVREKGQVTALVHSRSEQSQWGLVEIIWSLNLDLSIRDFSFQRCRSHKKNLVLTKEFKQQLIGKNYFELLSFIDPAGKLNEKLLVDREAKDLAQLLVQSSLKTIALTDLCWGQKLKEIREPYRVKYSSLPFKSEIIKGIGVHQDKDNILIKAQLSKTPAIFLNAKIVSGKISELFIPISTAITPKDMAIIKKEILEIVVK
jgi:hypothetical protein